MSSTLHPRLLVTSYNMSLGEIIPVDDVRVGAMNVSMGTIMRGNKIMWE